MCRCTEECSRPRGTWNTPPKVRHTANLKMLTIENVRVDYVHTPVTRPREAQVGHAAVKTAKNLHNKPETLILIDHAEITDSEFGFVNEAAKPPYRVFLSHGALHLENISNHLSEGSGTRQAHRRIHGYRNHRD